jgi:hypothetical protein
MNLKAITEGAVLNVPDANTFTREAFLRAGFEAAIHNAEALTRELHALLEALEREKSFTTLCAETIDAIEAAQAAYEKYGEQPRGVPRNATASEVLQAMGGRP